jgi:hypothetical protein
MVNPGYSGNIDDSDLPLLPWWYISGITAQNVATATLSAPNQRTQNQLPSDLTYVTVTGNYVDGGGNWLGGYVTFEQSNDLLYGPDPSTGLYYRIPARLTGSVPIANTLGFNWDGSGRVYIQFGTLTVNLLATDTTPVVIQVPYANTQVPGYVAPTGWVYHVKEYFQDGMEYDIAPTISQATTGADINSLIIPNTLAQNAEWSPQWNS